MPTDDERQAVVDRIQQALAADLIAFDELDDRFALVYGATSRAELEHVAATVPQLPVPPPPAVARHIAPSSSLSVAGDIKIGGWLALADTLRASSVIGDVVIDLSSTAIDSGATVDVKTVLGDVKLILPDGVRVQLETNSLIGDRDSRVVAPREGAPVVRLSVFSVLGDVKVYSLSEVPEGSLRKLWRSLRRDSTAQ